LRQAVRTNPNHAEAQALLTWLLLHGPEELRDAKAALAGLRQGGQGNPGNADARNSLAWALRTGPKDVRDNPEALTHARKATELVDNNPNFKNTLGFALYRNDKYRDAVQLLEKSLAGNDGKPEAAFDHVSLAMCFHRLGEKVRAEAHLTRAASEF